MTLFTKAVWGIFFKWQAYHQNLDQWIIKCEPFLLLLNNFNFTFLKILSDYLGFAFVKKGTNSSDKVKESTNCREGLFILCSESIKFELQ